MHSSSQVENQFVKLSQVLRKGLSKMKPEAHGGNSVLLVYPPKQEQEYIKKAKEIYDGEDYRFINIATQLIDQVDDLGGLDSLVEEIELVGEIPKRFFKDPFLERIRGEIKEAIEKNRVPILIRVGALVGIVSLNRILEDSKVLSLKGQIVALYPGIYRSGRAQLFFLDEYREASSYRAKIIAVQS